MKRRATICLALCFCMLLCLLPCSFDVHAKNEIILLVINNTVIRPLVNSIMPIRIDDSIYMPYKMLANFSTVKFYYNDSLEQLVIYNSQKRIVFDMANNRAYDDNGVSYNQTAKQIGESIYVPFDVICSYFDIYWSFTNYTDIAPIFRINEGDLIVNDENFSKQLNTLLQNTFDAYISSGQNDIPILPTDPDKPVLNKKLGYIFFEGIDLSAVMAMSSGAVFFLSEQDIAANSDLIRQAISKGHEIGLLLDGDSSISLKEQFISLNQSLNLKACYTAHLVSINGGSKNIDRDQIDQLILSGARLWDSNLSFDPSKDNSIEDLTASVSSLETTAVISLSASEKSINALPDLYKALNSIDLSLLDLELWTTPINQLNDIR